LINKFKLLMLSLLLLTVALTFTAALNAASLKRVYTRVLTAEFNVVGVDTQMKIEKAVRFGKLLEKFIGLNQLLTSMQSRLPGLRDAMVVLPDGTPIYKEESTSNADLVGKSAAAHYLAVLQQTGKPAKNTEIVMETEDHIHLLFPIHDQQDDLSGIMVLRFAKTMIDRKVHQVLLEQAVVLAFTAAAAALILALCLWFSPEYDENGRLLQRHPYLSVIAILLAAQVFFSIHSVNLFRNENIAAVRQQALTQASLTAHDLEQKILSKGISIHRLKGIEKQFTDIIATNNDLESMQILAPDGKILNMADGHGSVAESTVAQLSAAAPGTDSLYAIDVTLRGKGNESAGQAGGYLRVNLSRSSINDRVKEVIYDGLTVVLLSLLFLLEMKFFLLYFMKKTGHQGDRHVIRIEPYAFARPAAFLFLFAWAMPLSFLPLKMQLLYQPMAGLSRDVVLGLPISAEMFCALFTALIAGGWTDRHGWHAPFITGILLSLTGCYLSAVAESGMAFIFFRGLTGLGYGLAWMAIQGFIFHNSNETNRALGYSMLVAGIFAGHICGTAVGAMLAERVGYDMVLRLSAGSMAASLAFALAFMNPYMKRPVVARSEQDFPLIDMVKLLCNRNFLAILFFSVVPFSICQVGLLYYAAPLYLREQGISQSSIGRVLMVYGLSVIFIAPLLSRLVDRSRKKSLFIVFGGIVGSFGLLSLYFVSGLAAVLVAVFSLGLSSSLAGPAQPALTLKIKLTQSVGTSRSMSIQRAADKLGQMAGPIFVGFLVASVGLEKSVAFTGLTFLIATVLFLLLFREQRDRS